MTPLARPLLCKNATGRAIRVLIVDDSLVIRHLIRQALGADPAFEIVGAEANGAAALARIPELKPDVVTLDVEMPTMDGLETLRHIRRLHPKLRTIMFSAVTARGAAVTLEALTLGADDYVTKAGSGGSLEGSLAGLRTELIPKIKQFFAVEPAAPVSPPPLRVAARAPTRASAHATPQLVVIGVSTGGPQALAQLIPALPADFPLPLVIVQHMPPMFTRFLADRLAADGKLAAKEAQHGMELKPGTIMVAPGDYHLRLRRVGTAVVAALDQGPQENSCRPSVDVLFRSAAETYGGATIAVMLTGMGSDGLRGTRALKEAGAVTVVQDRETSVVWGMPGAVAEAGLADRVLPLQRIPAELLRLAGR